MNFRDLEYFVQLANDRNYTKTAQHFSVSQPTITYMVKRLEDELQVQLFVRDQSHHQVNLTLAGNEFLAHAQKILTELHTVKSDLKALSAQKVRFGLPPIIGNYYFPQLAQKLLQENLMSHLETVEAGSATLTKQLQEGNLDVAILGAIEPISIPEIATVTLAKTRFKIIVSKDHRLKDVTAIKFSELKSENFIALKEGFVHPAALRELTEKNGFQPKIVYTTPDINVLKGMVHENVGIGFLSEMAISGERDLHAIDILDDDQPLFNIVLAYHPQVNPLIEQLINVLARPV
ncbi:LysR family transcriptional regulator [Amylolactobacillus amylotrophicus DSM 20534]|uniref:LysR family transcriptional regulator n=3 Tax=Amylolactobacillus TaxID=2767876 RepID=A0A1L6XDC9_9LACO|nr:MULTISPECIES: LysR family transcriptional regulator [Amylolactobacillus]APT18979.1 LysR family transcriptional regulator [Amylolactobacillus amylophilus DSM 20533 = JCM 1125]KRK38759.1 LysR family transcriptional regulator [Amylolactobacillus amylotrophicus DSM 20534]KRM42598.1 LysR family transcriptional regulator [Amylolactobacillus amylophilus DSM 20533 = JCM 1125]GED79979.1 LysR family transcriptional regulator [Amylolactobacillus amylophilus]